MFNFRRKIATNQLDVMDMLRSERPFVLNGDQRVEMTTSCGDCDAIPKSKDAGKIIRLGKEEVQVMFNGMLVKRGGYHGDWMEKIITTLKGHHEPQEEKVFYEILKQIGAGGSMIELGSFWAYYSIWFNMQIKNAKNIACEPDPENMKIGKHNARLNKADIKFYNTAAGSEDGANCEFTLDSDPNKTITTKVKSVDRLVEENKLKKLDLLHMDIQGVEMDALAGTIDTIKRGKLRFLVVSTHHYFFSGNPLTHQECMNFIVENGGHIIAEHSVMESFSGDGLIAASFDKKDRNLNIDISTNRASKSLFRTYEQDLGLLINRSK